MRGRKRHNSTQIEIEESWKATFISDKIQFEIAIVIRDQESQVIMIKRSIQKGSISIVNIYTPSI